MNETYLEMAKSSYKPRKQAVTQQTIPEDKIDLSTVTDDDLRRECKEGLVLLMRQNKGKPQALAVIRELLDRIDGRPVQGINLKATIMPVLQVNLNGRKQDNV